MGKKGSMHWLLGWAFGRGDVERAQGHFCDSRDAHLRKDGLEDVQQSVVLDHALRRRAAAEEEVIPQSVDGCSGHDYARLARGTFRVPTFVW